MAGTNAVRPGPAAGAAGAGRRPSAAPAAILAAALALGVGLALLALAVPRTVAAWRAMDGDRVYQDLALGRSVPGERLQAAIAGLDVALEWRPTGDRFYMRAASEVELYRRLTAADAARSGWLDAAGRDLERGLAANPADGRASLLLAVVRSWQGRLARDVVPALLHSMDTAPNLRALWQLRATVFLAAWSALAPDEADAVRSQLRAIWRTDPGLRPALFEAARASGRLDELARALADEPAARAEFERLRNAPAPRR